MQFRHARITDIENIAELAVSLWDGHEKNALCEEFFHILHSPDAAVFVAEEQKKLCGFAQCQLRRDYVEGASSSPTGYLEGIYVKASCRRQGVATALLRRCECWAQEKGCKEFASDCALDNVDSAAFHMRSGFCETARLICFIKQLPPLD